MPNYVNPLHYQSVQDYLDALGFTIQGEHFTRENVRFPATEIVGCTPTSFYQKAQKHQWFELAPEIPGYAWGDQFNIACDLWFVWF